MQRLTPGFILSERYRLIGHVASGGMGQVWEALDDVLQRRVALKIMHLHTQDEIAMAARFRDEARFGAQLVHPNIVTIHDFLEFEGLSYLVMEMVDGLTLAELLARGPLAVGQARSLLSELASALTVAHEAGVIHRDIKPANVLVSDTGAKLTDFGIARSVEGGSHTLTGQLLGTANYLSPEHALGQKPGPASDIYGLGVLAHEMLTGKRPFERATPIATALAHVQDPPPPLPPGTPEDIASLVAACLAKDPEERPSAAMIVEMLGTTDPVSEAPLGSQDNPVHQDGPVAQDGSIYREEPEATMAMTALPRRAIIQS